MKRKIFKIFLIIASFVSIIMIAFDNRLIKKTYKIESNKLRNNLKIIQISDLHSCIYGENQQELIDILEYEEPDFVVLSGDILDDKRDEAPVFTLLTRIGKEYGCFYSTGNHEIWTNEADRIKKEFKEYGINVLDGNMAEIEINNEVIDIFGVDDPEIGDEEFFKQYINVLQNVRENKFSVLISHRPEIVDLYEAFKGDLILSGHTHGGQFRIPLLLNGIFAPHQGFFPKYSGGLYEIENSKMIISRGLSRENTCIPRIFNRPEVVIINVIGKK